MNNKTKKPLGKLHSVPSACDELGGLSLVSARKHIAQGNIRVVRLGKRTMIPDSELERIKLQGLPRLRWKRNPDSAPDVVAPGESADAAAN